MSEEKKNTIFDRLYRAQEIALCMCRKWWRPLTAMGIAASMLVHGAILPLMLQTSPDLMGLAALVTAAAGAFAVREWGKFNGVSEEED